MFFLLSLYVVFEALCRHSGLMFLWPHPDAVQRSDSFQSRDICVCCLVTNGDRCGGRWNHGNHFRGKVQRDWQPGASQTEWGARRVLFLAFDPFFFLFFFGRRSRPCWGGRAVIDRRGCRGDGWISLFSTLRRWQRSEEAPNPLGDED